MYIELLSKFIEFALKTQQLSHREELKMEVQIICEKLLSCKEQPQTKIF